MEVTLVLRNKLAIPAVAILVLSGTVGRAGR